MNAFVAAAALASALLIADRATAQPAPVDVSSRKQLFVDELLIAESEGIALTVNRPVKDPEPVMEGYELRWSLYNAVLKDKDAIRLYYNPIVAGKLRMAYAESKDGVHWTRPNLGIVEIDGSKDNNIVFPLEDTEGVWTQISGGNVCIDANPACPEEERYKMPVWWHPPGEPDWKTWVCASPDGLHWKPISDEPSFRNSDTGNTMWWDADLGRYVAYVRIWGPPPSPRKIGRCEFDDCGDWGKEQVVFEADEKDPQVIDFYTNAAAKYQGVYMMFPSVHAWSRDYLLTPEHADKQPADRKVLGAWDVQFATSRDGIRWTRLDRSPFVPDGEYNEWDAAMISMCHGLIETDTEIWMYYWGRNWPHLMQFAPDGPFLPGRYGVGRLRLRLDGFVSADAAYTGGELTTVPITFSGKGLELNFQTGVGGSVKVEMQDADGKPVPGFTLDEADEIYGNFIHRTVTWQGKDDVGPLAGKPVVLRFAMRDAKLYAFQFVE